MDGEPVRISAVVPVKNASEYLSECLESILEQSISAEFTIEVSLYNDGSTDSTLQTIAFYESKFMERGISFICSSSDRSRGVGYAKNRSIEQCSGSVLVFCDADDISAKHRFSRLYKLLHTASDPDLTLIGSKFERIPVGSTSRYTQWANSLDSKQIYDQIFTSHGPSLVAPTWCMSRKLYERIGGFCEAYPVGYPEDLHFFYDAFRIGAKFIKVECLVSYRYHPKCASLDVNEKIIWKMRIAMFEEQVLVKWKEFMIWGAGKVGKKFYRSLSDENRSKMKAFCDIDEKKIKFGRYEYFDPEKRKIIATVPIVSLSEMIPPIAVCLKMDFINSEEVNRIFRGRGMVEGRNYFHLG